MHDTVVIANAGSTAVVVVTDEFTSLAHTMAANAGRAGLRVVSLPYPLEGRAEEDVRVIAREWWQQLFESLGAQ